MPKALQHVAPEWSDVPEIYLRIVSARRARKLRKRGVSLTGLAPGQYFWAEPPRDVADRKARRGARCLEMHRRTVNGSVGRKHWLATRLAEQRAAHQTARLQRRWVNLCKYVGKLHQNLTYAKYWVDESYVLETASGKALNAIYKTPVLPLHILDDELRMYMQQRYALRLGGATPEDRAQHMSPPVTVWVAKLPDDLI